MVRLIIKKSNIDSAGTGLFADEDIAKGSVVLTFSSDAFYITKASYDEQQHANNKLMIQTGCRFVGDIFLYTDARNRYENYINHSFHSNVLYLCGVCFAKHDIKKDEEITIDYRYILSENDLTFTDTQTNQEVKAFDGVYALKKAAQELIDVLNDVQTIH